MPQRLEANNRSVTKYNSPEWVVGALISGLPLLFLGIGIWVAFRLINYPVFGDFLIAVEAEMNKVSWPSKTELYRATIVVLVVMFVMAGSIFLFDVVLHWIAWAIGIAGSGESLS